jgi:hypothetical protein
MFAGFNLLDLSEEFITLYSKKGSEIYEGHKEHIEKELDSFILKDGSIDGSKLQDDWFPQIEADIFLSHSHGDKEKAIAFAGWLSAELGLSAFIDSCVWGYANNLLKKIDNVYCMNTDGKTYNYDLRNFSTSHVHMMLSNALTKMMHKTECVIFLNTPNSIQTKDVVVNQTKSPWIYHEIAMTHVLRKKKPNRLGFLKKGYLFENAQVLTVTYDTKLDHLIKLEMADLLEWQKTYDSKRTTHALDILYNKYKLIGFQLSD